MKSYSIKRFRVSMTKDALLDKCQELVHMLDSFGFEQEFDTSGLCFYVKKLTDCINDITYLKNRLLTESLELIGK